MAHGAHLYVGLISGTSADAIDAALVAIDGEDLNTEHTLAVAFPTTLKQQLDTALRTPDALTARALGTLDSALGDAFGDATLKLLNAAGYRAGQITAIGSHGQTLYHEPDAAHPFTLQVGDGARIAARTGIDVVNDFRRADIANGGQGAPLAPLLHDKLLRDSNVARAVLNLGGIANLTYLAPGAATSGCDTGPANTLMDCWAQWCGIGAYDEDGRMARAGTLDKALLHTMRDDPYFAKPAPKSTGREHFNADWLAARLDMDSVRAARLPVARQADIMTTLCALTATSVADAVTAYAADTQQLIVCGGGAANPVVLGMLADALPDIEVTTSDAFGIDSGFVEATLFAWLAAAHVNGTALDTRAITGSQRHAIAGTRHYAPGRTP